jgi:hypothetical protein
MAYIKYQGILKNVSIAEGNSSVIFDNIELPAGPGKFEAFINYDSKDTGVQFVDVERIN